MLMGLNVTELSAGALWDGLVPGFVAMRPLCSLLPGGWLLRLTHARAQDGGHYSCLASNMAGEARKHFYVEVLGKERASRISVSSLQEEAQVKTGHGGSCSAGLLCALACELRGSVRLPSC